MVVALMQELLAQLAETKKLIAANSEDIAHLQKELSRLARDAKSVAAVRAKLDQFHSLHIQVLAVQALLRKTLKDIGAE